MKTLRGHRKLGFGFHIEHKVHSSRETKCLVFLTRQRPMIPVIVPVFSRYSNVCQTLRRHLYFRGSGRHMCDEQTQIFECHSERERRTLAGIGKKLTVQKLEQIISIILYGSSRSNILILSRTKLLSSYVHCLEITMIFLIDNIHNSQLRSNSIHITELYPLNYPV